MRCAGRGRCGAMGRPTNLLKQNFCSVSDLIKVFRSFACASKPKTATKSNFEHGSFAIFLTELEAHFVFAFVGQSWLMENKW